MSQQIVDAHLEGMHSQSGGESLIALTFYTLAASPVAIVKAAANYRRGSVRHISDVKKIRRKGRTTSMMNAEECIEATFDFIAEGVTRTGATDGAASSAQMPAVLSKVDVTNAPVIPCGWRADALNSVAEGGFVHPWIYEGDGSLTMDDEEAWGGSITLRRYRGIPTHSMVVNS